MKIKRKNKIKGKWENERKKGEGKDENKKEKWEKENGRKNGVKKVKNEKKVIKNEKRWKNANYKQNGTPDPQESSPGRPKTEKSDFFGPGPLGAQKPADPGPFRRSRKEKLK